MYFNQVAGRFDRSYGPGRSWQAFGHLLLGCCPLTGGRSGIRRGSAGGTAGRRCRKVIAVDNSEKMVEFGARKARKNGLKNLEFRQGDLQSPPSIPTAWMSRCSARLADHAEDPAQALRAVFTILKPGGQLLLLDLVKHSFDKARDLMGTVGWVSRIGPSSLARGRRIPATSRSAWWPARNRNPTSKPSWPPPKTHGHPPGFRGPDPVIRAGPRTQRHSGRRRQLPLEPLEVGLDQIHVFVATVERIDQVPVQPKKVLLDLRKYVVFQNPGVFRMRSSADLNMDPSLPPRPAL